MKKNTLLKIGLSLFSVACVYSSTTGMTYGEVTKPEITTRAEWGADESLVTEAPEYRESVTHLVINHTGTDPVDEDGEVMVGNIYKNHVGRLGDMGYNALIAPNGTIYEGKKGKGGDQVLEDGVVGSHAFGFNRSTFGIGLLGNFNNKPLPEKMRNSLIHLLAFEAQQWGIDPLSEIEYVRNYHATLSAAQQRQVPERDLGVPAIQGAGLLPRASTESPGEYVKRDLPQIREDVAALLASK